MAARETHRVALVQLAINNNPKFLADTYAFATQPGTHDFHYMWNISNPFCRKQSFLFIMGTDLCVDIAEGKWMDAG